MDSPDKKKQKTTAALAKKVEALCAWAEGGVRPAGLDKVPTTRVRLRKWSHAESGFLSWKTATIDSPRGRNAVLMEMVFAAVKQIQARDGAKPVTELDDKTKLIAENERLRRQSAKQQEQLRKMSIELQMALSSGRRR